MALKKRSAPFTLNNWVQSDVDFLKSLKVKYLVFGFEIGEEGTRHLQGYVEFPNPINLCSKVMKKGVPKISWIFDQKGTPLQASDYCKKGEDRDGYVKRRAIYSDTMTEPPNTFFWECGVISQQGKRTDIDNCVELIQDGNSLKQVAKCHPNTFVKFHKGFRALKSTLSEPRNEKPIVQVFWGPTGTGKSYAARDCFKTCEIDYYVWTPARKMWWDGYDDHKGVLMEEFRGNDMSMAYLLVLLDQYECPVECKGGTVEFIATRIIITSPKHPKDWYENKTNDQIDQLLRRIDSIELFDEVYNPELFED